MKVSREDSINFKPQKNSSLMLGIIFVAILGAVLFLLLRSEQTSTKIDSTSASLDDRLSKIEDQLLMLDEVNSDSLIEVGAELQFLDKEIRKLWDLSNKRNKVNIEKLTKSLNELIQKYNKTDKEIDDAIASINTELNNLTQSIENQPDLSGTVSQSEAEIRSLKRQILFIEESVQALEAYRTQNNQILLEIQNSINNEVVIDE
ncbi:MAG: hypothetical protein CM15mP11_01450 [Gammaproteobacteria bacterium]|jgi:hypothetical protein|nr:MAG: hypothetical protein CM15mP11_01450 [Gammaproteobacteria bacterium]|tara:strand:+ start:91 stop:702 length:612 start_codon:yes stop_codon:yes gene_type:complete